MDPIFEQLERDLKAEKKKPETRRRSEGGDPILAAAERIAAKKPDWSFLPEAQKPKGPDVTRGETTAKEREDRRLVKNAREAEKEDKAQAKRFAARRTQERATAAAKESRKKLSTGRGIAKELQEFTGPLSHIPGGRAVQALDIGASMTNIPQLRGMTQGLAESYLMGFAPSHVKPQAEEEGVGVPGPTTGKAGYYAGLAGGMIPQLLTGAGEAGLLQALGRLGPVGAPARALLAARTTQAERVAKIGQGAAWGGPARVAARAATIGAPEGAVYGALFGLPYAANQEEQPFGKAVLQQALMGAGLGGALAGIVPPGVAPEARVKPNEVTGDVLGSPVRTPVAPPEFDVPAPAPVAKAASPKAETVYPRAAKAGTGYVVEVGPGQYLSATNPRGEYIGIEQSYPDLASAEKAAAGRAAVNAARRLRGEDPLPEPKNDPTLLSPESKELFAYVRRIKNRHKQAYAKRYLQWKLRGEAKGEPAPNRPDVLHTMAAQAVELEINELVTKSRAANAPTPAPEPVAAAAKKPWEVTRDTYVKSELALIPPDMPGNNVFYQTAQGKRLRGTHQAAVENALSEGKPVPPEVLADYPDLAAKGAVAEPPAPGFADRIRADLERLEAQPKAESSFDWGKAKAGDILPDGRQIVRRHIPRKKEARALAEAVGGTVAIDGDRWAAFGPFAKPPPDLSTLAEPVKPVFGVKEGETPTTGLLSEKAGPLELEIKGSTAEGRAAAEMERQTGQLFDAGTAGAESARTVALRKAREELAQTETALQSRRLANRKESAGAVERGMLEQKAATLRKQIEDIQGEGWSEPAAPEPAAPKGEARTVKAGRHADELQKEIDRLLQENERIGDEIAGSDNIAAWEKATAKMDENGRRIEDLNGQLADLDPMLERGMLDDINRQADLETWGALLDWKPRGDKNTIGRYRLVVPSKRGKLASGGARKHVTLPVRPAGGILVRDLADMVGFTPEQMKAFIHEEIGNRKEGWILDTVSGQRRQIGEVHDSLTTYEAKLLQQAIREKMGRAAQPTLEAVPVAEQPKPTRIDSFLDAQEAAARAAIERLGTRLTTGVDPEFIAAYARLGAVKIAKGAVKFEQWAEVMLEEFGEAIKPHLKAIYLKARSIHKDELQPTLAGLEDRPTGKRGISKARVAAEREAAGLPPIEVPAVRSKDASYSAGKRWVDRGGDIDGLAQELMDTGRAADATELGALAYRLDQIKDAVGYATPENRAGLLDMQNTVQHALRRGGSRAWHEAGQALQLTIGEETDLGNVYQAAREAHGKALTPEQIAKIDALHERYQNLKIQYDQLKAKTESRQRVVAEKVEGVRQAETARQRSSFGGRNKVFTTDRLQRAREVIAQYQPGGEGPKKFAAGVPAELLEAYVEVGGYYLEGGLRAFGDWRRAMIDELGKQIEPHLNDIYGRLTQDKRLAAALKRTETEIGKVQEAVAAGEPIAKPPPMKWTKELIDKRAELAEAKEQLLRQTDPPLSMRSAREVINALFHGALGLVASFDNSVLGRQGGKMLVARPKSWLEAAKAAHQAMRSEGAAQLIHDAIEAHPDFAAWRQAGVEYLSLSERAPIAAMEESAMYARQAGRLFGKLGERATRPFSRAFTTGSNVMRWNAAYRMGRAKGPEWIGTHGEGYANLLNLLTARGKLGKTASSAYPLLANLLISPKGLWAEFQLPMTLFQGTGAVRIEAAKSLAAYVGSYIAFGMAVNYASGGKARVGIDPRDPQTFGILRVGDTRFNVLGTFRTAYAAGVKVMDSLYKHSRFAQEDPSVLDRTWSEEATRYLGYKAPPGLQVGKSLVNRYRHMEDTPGTWLTKPLADWKGDPIRARDLALEQFIPWNAQDVIEAWKGESAVMAAAVAATSFYGVSANTYPDQPTKRRKRRKGAAIVY